MSEIGKSACGGREKRREPQSRRNRPLSRMLSNRRERVDDESANLKGMILRAIPQGISDFYQQKLDPDLHKNW
jgi:hypothetical protein